MGKRAPFDGKSGPRLGELLSHGTFVGEGLIAAADGAKEGRLFAYEPEFARVLAVCERDSNTLSAIIRESWDHDDLRVMTKKPLVANNVHLSILAPITEDELRTTLTST